MSVQKKGRRKIVCNDKLYVWYVGLDYDSPYNVLHILSEDKQLVLACPLNIATAYVVSKGNRFQNAKTNGRWNRYLLPFEVPETITPKFVAKLIDWATGDSGAAETEWDGKAIMI